jgi:hypothetical protein
MLRYPGRGVGAGLRGISRQAEIARDVDARHGDIAECGRYGYRENMRRGGILSIYRYSGENEELRHNKRERLGDRRKAQEVAENLGDKPYTLITIGLTRSENWRNFGESPMARTRGRTADRLHVKLRTCQPLPTLVAPIPSVSH